jgi:hypothetical protein
VRHAAQKTVSWFLFLTGLGPSIFFLCFCGYEGLPTGPNTAWYFWPLCSFLLAAFSALYLRGLYRQERAVPRGRWQISLRDLVAVSLFTAGFFYVWSAYAPETFIFRGMGSGLIAALALTLGVLAASRAGFQRFPWKHVYAVAVVLRSLGYVGLTLFFGLCVICTVAGRVEQLLFHSFTPRWDTHDFALLFVPIRLGLPALLPSMFLCWLALRQRPLPKGTGSAPSKASEVPTP